MNTELKKIGLVNAIFVDGKSPGLIEAMVEALTEQQHAQMKYGRAVEIETTVRDGKEYDSETEEWFGVRYVQTTGRVTDVAASVMGIK